MRKLSFLFIILFAIHAQAGDSGALIKPGEKLVGARIALGSVYGAGLGVVLSGEYGVRDNLFDLGGTANTLGVAASLGYSGYSQSYSWGTYSYTNILLITSGLWHVDLLNDPKIDTYASLSMGWNIGTVSSPSGGPQYSNTYSGLIWGTAVGARYHFSDKLSAVGELGFGMGVLRVGIDYRL
ncbi:MAG TPA: hypothetical protein ENJ89_10495 [Caldithrix abyssi]|uniref:Outer membrane protein beta-barrel domain-containing protein n=1 Tax=Caldithrix abyssi TaxID=187145 RepID=A0A7V5PQX9_CALAY|nr:hypothetical protein [Caldithrix abyssi]